MPPALRAAPNFGGKRFGGGTLASARPRRSAPPPILYHAPGAPRRPQLYTMPPALHAAPNFGGNAVYLAILLALHLICSFLCTKLERARFFPLKLGEVATAWGVQPEEARRGRGKQRNPTIMHSPLTPNAHRRTPSRELGEVATAQRCNSNKTPKLLLIPQNWGRRLSAGGAH